MKKIRFEGSFVALITPFKDGGVDEAALRRLVRRQIASGTAGLVPCGSTGEAVTLRPKEYRRVVQITVEEAAGSIPVLCGAGTNDTARTVEACQRAEGLGADAVLVLVPYYNKPTQDGIFKHFSEVAQAVRLPIVVYNIPGRTGVNLQPATLAALARAHANLAAVKEASGSVDQVSEILSLCPAGFTVLSGDDSLTLPMMAVGAKGVVSVVANIAPRQTARLCQAALKGDMKTARKLHLKMFPLVKALFLETNPIPVKAAAHKLGLCTDELRLPLVPMSAEPRRKLYAELKRFGLGT